MTKLTDRIARAVDDKGLSIGDARNLLSEALEYIERLEAASQSHPPVTVRGEPMACPCGKCGPSGLVVHGELEGYFGER